MTYAFGYGALNYATGGEERLGRFAARALDRLYEQMDWIEAHRTGSWDNHYSIEIWLRSWQQLANTPLLTPEQRRHGYEIMAFLAGQMQMYQWNLDAYGKTTERSLSRHQYAGIFAGDALCRFIQKQCALEGDLATVVKRNRANFGTVIETMQQSYCDGFDHKWGLDGNWHLLQAALEEPRTGFIASGMARLSAEHALACLNNAGNFVNFGAENIGALEPYDAYQILGRAEAIYRDGKYQYWLDKMPSWPYKVFILSLTWLGHWYATNDTPRPNGSGLANIPLSKLIYEDLTAGRGRIYEGLPVVNSVPYAETFNKLALRDGTASEDQYLLLDGLGGVTYSGNDAGGLSEYSRYGQRLLVQIEGKPDPFYQNTVSVSRGNALDPTGAFAKLRCQADRPEVIYTQVQVDPLCGAASTRHLFLEKGGYCVLFDDVTLQQDDAYALTCNFRGLGEPQLDAATGTLVLHNALADLRLQNLRLPGQDAPVYSLTDRTSGVSVEEAKFKVRVLRETVARPFKAGETYRYANVFYGTRRTDGPEYRATSTGDGAVLVTGSKPVLYAAAQGATLKLGALEVAAEAVRVSTNSVQFFGLRKLRQDGQTLAEFATAQTITLYPGENRTVPAVKLDCARVGAAALAALEWAQQAPYVAPPMVGLGPRATALQPREQRTLLQGVGAINDVQLADVNSDGRDEVIAAGEDAHLRVVDAFGKLLLDLPTAGKSPLLTCWFGRLAGQPTLLAGALDGGLYAFDPAGKLRWSTRNTHLWYGPLPSCYSLAVGDFSGTGVDQIALGTHGGVSLCSATGEFLRFTQVYAHAVKPAQAVRFPGDKQATLLVNTWGGGPKLVDPAGGHAYDAWFCVWGGSNVYLQPHDLGGETYLVYGGVNGTACGHLLKAPWQAGQRTSAAVFGKDSWYLASDGETTAVLVQDVNGDGRPEIVSGNETGFLVTYDLSGRRLMAKLAGTRPNQLLATDLNGDGQTEILMAGEDPGLTIFNDRLQTLGTWSPGLAITRLWFTDGRLACLTAANTIETLTLRP